MKREIKRRDSIITSCANIIFPLCMIMGLFMILHGLISRESGIQGGIILAAGLFFLFLAYGQEGINKIININRFKIKNGTRILSFLLVIFLGIMYLGALFMTYMAHTGKGEHTYSYGAAFWINFSLALKVICPVVLLIIIVVNLLNSRDEE